MIEVGVLSVIYLCLLGYFHLDLKARRAKGDVGQDEVETRFARLRWILAVVVFIVPLTATLVLFGFISG